MVSTMFFIPGRVNTLFVVKSKKYVFFVWLLLSKLLSRPSVEGVGESQIVCVRSTVVVVKGGWWRAYRELKLN